MKSFIQLHSCTATRLAMLLLIVTATFSSCSSESDETTNSSSKMQNLAAPTPPALIIENISDKTVKLSCIFAQTTAGPGAPVQITHKDAGFVTILPGYTVTYADYVNASPSSYNLNWWTVNNSTDPLLSGIFQPITVQNTYGNPFWCGVYITAENYTGEFLYQVSSGFKYTVGNPTLGSFNSNMQLGDVGAGCKVSWSILNGDTRILVTTF